MDNFSRASLACSTPLLLPISFLRSGRSFKPVTTPQQSHGPLLALGHLPPLQSPLRRIFHSVSFTVETVIEVYVAFVKIVNSFLFFQTILHYFRKSLLPFPPRIFRKSLLIESIPLPFTRFLHQFQTHLLVSFSLLRIAIS